MGPVIELLWGLALGLGLGGAGCLLLLRRLRAETARADAADALRSEFSVRANLLRAEREAAEDAARRIEAALDALPLPLWRRDGEQRLAWCNSAYALAADAPREKLLAGGDGIGGAALSRRLSALARLALAARTAQSEAEHIVVSGARRLYEFVEAPLPDGGTVGMAVDQTEREEAGIELARHIAAQGSVLETMPVAIGIFGADKRLKYFNSAYARLWRADEQWLAGEPEYGEILENLRERRRLPEVADFRMFKRQRLKLFDSLFESFDELMYLPDGTTLRERCMPHPLGGLLFAFEDVTDRLVLERSYNTLIAVQRATLDNLYEGVAVFGSDGRLKLHNPAFARIWDIPDAALIAEPHIADVVERMRGFYPADADWPSLKERLVEKLTSRDAANARIERTDGRVLDYALVPLPDGATQLSYVDVTDKVRVEQALRERAEALEAADRLKSEFISTVSYELRTPLNTIIGFAELLAKQYFGELNKRQSEYCADILTASERLLAIINDILDLASIDAGRMTLELAAVDPVELLSDTAQIMGDLARERELKLDVVNTRVPRLRGDERRLKQAMCNLVSNALKFTPPGGVVRLSAQADERMVSLEISDNGVGIPLADQARVFKEFERGTAPDARRMGAGLGLSLVKRIVELHGGSIDLVSNPGEGTRVTCRLPLWVPGERAVAADD
jgi:signal transduction histidine kinase